MDSSTGRVGLGWACTWSDRVRLVIMLGGSFRGGGPRRQDAPGLVAGGFLVLAGGHLLGSVPSAGAALAAAALHFLHQVLRWALVPRVSPSRAFLAWVVLPCSLHRTSQGLEPSGASGVALSRL